VKIGIVGVGLLIQPQGVDALDRLGVGAAFSAASVPINHLLGKTHRNWTIVDVPYRHRAARATRCSPRACSFPVCRS
jgi:2-polyprenyl-6-methoxyphenol hydroxylase-like FAD-dependent oxidoreductase